MTRLRDLVQRPPRPAIQLPGWLEYLISLGIVSSDAVVIERQRCVNVAAFAVAATALSHLVINAVHNFHGFALVNADNVFMLLIALLVPRLHRFGDHVGAIALALAVLFGQMFIVWSLGRSSELHVYYALGGAMLFFFGVENWRLFLVLFGLYVAALVIALNFAPAAGLAVPEDREFRDLLSSQAMINAAAIIAALIFYALWDRDRAKLALQHEHERSEALIATVMPQAIAARLKSGREERIADKIEMLSVMFADLAGFTAAAHDLSPEEVVDFLDRLVRALDALCEQHQVDKIKTIGDSYMAAGGFDGRAAAAAVAIGRLALAMMDVIENQPPLGCRKLKLRVGIHCGPATAGVIGDTRFSYDVWGDAVNTASRMESYGEPGRIQVSEAFHALTSDVFAFEERGATEIKGLGVRKTFFLLAARG
ncbi:MAG TPA: adenylate/guanylate cyclase domain-containing protein [Xanthobacteraceae bacterium]|jgi:adenylate cyclase